MREHEAAMAEALADLRAELATAREAHEMLTRIVKRLGQHRETTPMLSASQVATELGVNIATVHTWCVKHGLGEKVGHSWVIPRDRLDAFDPSQHRMKPGRKPKHGNGPETVVE